MAQVVIITLESNGSSVHRTTTRDGSEVQVRIGHKGKLSFFVSPRTETPFLWVPGLSSSTQRHDLVRALGTYKEDFTTTSTCTARVLCPTARDSFSPSPRGLHEATAWGHSSQPSTSKELLEPSDLP